MHLLPLTPLVPAAIIRAFHTPLKTETAPATPGHDTMQQFQSHSLSVINSIPFLPNLAPWAETLVGVGILLAIAWIANFIIKHIVLRIVTRWMPYEDLTPLPVAARLANIVPALIISNGIGAVPHLPAPVITLVSNVVSASIILFIAMALSKALTLANDIYEHRPSSATRPIKGYIQLLKIILYVGAAILIIAALMDQSPLLLLSGLGAMAAVILLVFKDTLLSLVASVQLTSNDMLRVGDWIEMPALNADGDVIDIALHTVKVQNWDKTITTIPTHRLISESFKNWRGMSEAGGRRIKRSIFIDQNGIRFLTPGEKDGFRRFQLLDDYLGHKQTELSKWNAPIEKAGRDEVNARRVTNIGTFRAYVVEYLRANSQIADGMTLLVRQLDPSPQGLPIEIYCFTSTTDWNAYEDIQSDIFDHLLAILPEFGLRPFQQPSGLDLQRGLAA
ncbi:mechanosensitive ion channel family protein [Sphingorhabdus sp. 109]|uniref:mechanosensitive ion channel family protein n=2 Tax=Sphingomonadaceae TaxID=41297 RepID=UPI0012EF0BD5|nr:mechanosensitive ion channel family protein [Sphingorhabdus sp. 109]VWX59012.1 Miniconductance mechanosensitive channel YbdG [Sphingorhabdus sp. 109]